MQDRAGSVDRDPELLPPINYQFPAGDGHHRFLCRAGGAGRESDTSLTVTFRLQVISSDTERYPVIHGTLHLPLTRQLSSARASLTVYVAATSIDMNPGWVPLHS